jgi:transposase InsO family protein
MIRDTITHWVKTFPIKAATAVAVVRILTEEIFPRFGFCEQIHSDRGTQFTRSLVTEVARILGIKATTTPAYNPKSNPVERFHRDLGRAIKALDKKQPNRWEEVLPHVLFVIRTSPCRSTGFTPYKLLFGHDVRIPLDLVFKPPPTPALSTTPTSTHERPPQQD